MELILNADNRKAVGSASSVLNCHNNQTDLDAFYRWSVSKSNRLPLNLANCQCLHIGYGIPYYVYTLGDQPILVVEQCADLGLIGTKNFSYFAHFNSVICTASRAAGLIHRMFSTRDQTFIKKLYVAYVRPILEYVSPVWNPTTVVLQKDLERVQCRFTIRHFGLGDMSYVERLAHLHSDTLVDRRNHKIL